MKSIYLVSVNMYRSEIRDKIKTDSLMSLIFELSHEEELKGRKHFYTCKNGFVSKHYRYN